jgi:DNA-binding CsgD family transcriptional regulator
VFTHQGTGLDVHSALDAILEASRDGALVIDAGTGQQLHRNHAIGELCAADPDFAAVEAAIRRVARAAWHCRRVSHGEPPVRDRVPRLAEDVRTERHAYVVHATNLPPGVSASADATLVLVEPSAAAVPSVQGLQRRFRLTAREAEVALLIAQGLTDAAIASRLGLSAHTVGHHAERIFDSLGVHTRTAIPLKLLERGARTR